MHFQNCFGWGNMNARGRRALKGRTPGQMGSLTFPAPANSSCQNAPQGTFLQKQTCRLVLAFLEHCMTRELVPAATVEPTSQWQQQDTGDRAVSPFSSLPPLPQKIENQTFFCSWYQCLDCIVKGYLLFCTLSILLVLGKALIHKLVTEMWNCEACFW